MSISTNTYTADQVAHLKMATTVPLSSTSQESSVFQSESQLIAEKGFVSGVANNASSSASFEYNGVDRESVLSAETQINDSFTVNAEVINEFGDDGIGQGRIEGTLSGTKTFSNGTNITAGTMISNEGDSGPYAEVTDIPVFGGDDGSFTVGVKTAYNTQENEFTNSLFADAEYELAPDVVASASLNTEDAEFVAALTGKPNDSTTVEASYEYLYGDEIKIAGLGVEQDLGNDFTGTVGGYVANTPEDTNIEVGISKAFGNDNDNFSANVGVTSTYNQNNDLDYAVTAGMEYKF